MNRAIGWTAALLLLAGPAAGAEVELRWRAVTTDVQGQPQVTHHYVVYCGRSPRPRSVHHPGDGTFRYERAITAGRAPDLRIPDLAPGQHWFFAVAAASADGLLSDYSPEVHLAIASPDGRPLPDPPEPAPVPKAEGRAADQAEPASCRTSGGPAAASAWLLLALGLVFFRAAVRRR